MSQDSDLDTLDNVMPVLEQVPNPSAPVLPTTSGMDRPARARSESPRRKLQFNSQEESYPRAGPPDFSRVTVPRGPYNRPVMQKRFTFA